MPTRQQVDADIDAQVYQNDQKAVTGQVLNDILHEIVEFADQIGGGTQTLTINTSTGRILLSGGSNIDISTFINSFIHQSARLFPNPLYTLPVSTLAPNFAPGTYEIGEVLALILTASYTQNLGGSQTLYRLFKDALAISTSNPYSVSLSIISGDITYEGVYTANAGTTQLADDFGNTTANTVAAGNWTSESLVYTGSYKVFFGSGASAPTTSAIVRALPNSIFANQTSKTFTIDTGTTNSKYIFCIPFTNSVVSITDLDGGGISITDLYTLQGLGTIDDAGGSSYTVKIYMMETAIPHSINHRHQVVFS